MFYLFFLLNIFLLYIKYKHFLIKIKMMKNKTNIMRLSIIYV